MKTPLFFLFLFLLGSLSAYGQLTVHHNHYRPDDEIIKQQVQYKDPGQPGRNLLWDFSRQQTINDQYTLTYSEAPLDGDTLYIMGGRRYPKDHISSGQLIVATEHNTMYYYHLSGDTLYQLGHENPTIKLDYTTPMIPIRYPFNYADQITTHYTSQGLYSGTVALQTTGRIYTQADAYGKLILPTGDTLSPVLRIKTIQTIHHTPQDGQQTSPVPATQLETCRWYSKGYRYPVFETIKNTNLEDQTPIFTTAFFFPPQDHLYLDTDPENQALLDELWQHTQDDGIGDNTSTKTITLEDIMTCRIYPNPVVADLHLEYTLKQDAHVSLELYTMDGLPVKTIQSQHKATGTHYETLDCTNLHPRNYVLRIRANNALVNEIIIKK